MVGVYNDILAMEQLDFKKGHNCIFEHALSLYTIAQNRKFINKHSFISSLI